MDCTAMPWIPRRERCALPGAREAAAVDELGEAYRSATHERAVEALAAEEDAARGQLAREERDGTYGLHRDAVDSEERAVRSCLEGGEAAAVDELGEAYRSATHERAVEALAAEEDAARGQLVCEEREDVYGLHRDAVDSEERAVRRCLEGGEAAAVDELGEAYRSATHERAVEALAAEEDAARGQLVCEEREDVYGLHRDAVDSEERAVRSCLEGGEAVAVDELGEAYRSATHERAVEALAAEEDAGSRSACPRRSVEARVWTAPRMPWIPRRERCAAAWRAARLRLWTSFGEAYRERDATSEQWRR
ncbi:Flagellar Member 3 [Trypanosoma cruzi]|nr:Flagellar Member 3 [Trypanosoma cruzi]